MIFDIVVGGLILYAIIHLHKKYGMSIFKVFFKEALIGVSIAFVLIFAVLIFLSIKHP